MTLETHLGCVEAALGSRKAFQTELDTIAVPSTLEPQEVFVLVSTSPGRELYLLGTMVDSHILLVDPSAD